VTVTSRENRSASATCTADYQQRLLGYGFWFGNELNGEEAKNYFAPSSDSAEEEVLTQAVKASFNTPTTTEAGYSVKLSETYTKPISEADYTPANYFEIEATEQFKDYITNVAKFDASQLPKWTSTDTEYESRRRLSAFFDENWGAALHGGEAAKRNALINALLRFGEEPAASGQTERNGGGSVYPGNKSGIVGKSTASGEYKNRSVWCDVLKRVKGAEEWQERKREREY
jgi:hypothetical protein